MWGGDGCHEEKQSKVGKPEKPTLLTGEQRPRGNEKVEQSEKRVFQRRQQVQRPWAGSMLAPREAGVARTQSRERPMARGENHSGDHHMETSRPLGGFWLLLEARWGDSDTVMTRGKLQDRSGSSVETDHGEERDVLYEVSCGALRAIQARQRQLGPGWCRWGVRAIRFWYILKAETAGCVDKIHVRGRKEERGRGRKGSTGQRGGKSNRGREGVEKMERRWREAGRALQKRHGVREVEGYGSPGLSAEQRGEQRCHYWNGTEWGQSRTEERM